MSDCVRPCCAEPGQGDHDGYCSAECAQVSAAVRRHPYVNLHTSQMHVGRDAVVAQAFDWLDVRRRAS